MEKKKRKRSPLAIILLVLVLLLAIGAAVYVYSVRSQYVMLDGVWIPRDSESLDLRNRGLKKVAPLRECTALKELDLRGNDIDPDELRALQEAGITPGYDFGLCTYDDWSWFSLISPGITAVRLETKQLGARAAELLLERLRGEREENAPAVRVELPTAFIERGSLVPQRST